MNTKPDHKIAIFGGSFDPIHLGHLAVADYTYHALNLDRLFFVPNFLSPSPSKLNFYKDHPDHEQLVNHRINMLKLALEPYPYFELSLWEIEQKQLSYTYLSILEFQKQYPQSLLYFILGSDALMFLSEWKNIELVFPNITFVIYSRGLRRINLRTLRLMLAYPDSFLFLEESMPLEISSTTIRSFVESDKTISSLVPLKVDDYIKKQNLYKKGTSL